MKIIAVCGMGIGTSIILKMTIDRAINDLGVDADVEAADISSARGAAAMADLVLTSAELADALGDVDTPIEVITDFTDVDAVKAAISRHAD
ncbi:PTS sugar transporter subunit IIB [Devriesea agamarum]|uniref:PTS sugar transporter subunit IIB n=1 Tax=Devriesea agamarum TaxID=472569 RepID=UPI00071C6F89|nr:PTS sugar transporter subunit IIB [Devriesea agamarum]